MARGDSSEDKDKYFKALYALGAIVMVVGLMLVIGFGSVRLVEYLDAKDYEEGTCHATGIYKYDKPDDADEYKIWCSCECNPEDRECFERECSAKTRSGAKDIPCWRLSVTVHPTGKTTWMRHTHHNKGYECTNSCDNRDLEGEYFLGKEYKCWYDPSDATAAAVPRQPSTGWIIHSLLWPCLVTVIGLLWITVTCVFHIRSKKSGSQSYA